MKLKLNSLSVSLLISSLSKCLFFGYGYKFITSVSGTSSLLSILIGGIFSFFIVKLVLICFNSMEGSMPIKIQHIFGKHLGNIINFIIIIFSFFLACLIFWRLNSFIAIEFLNYTPRILLSLIMCLVIAYLSHISINSFFRFIAIVFLISTIINLFNFYGCSSYFNFNNLLPLFSVSKHEILLSSIYFCIFFSGLSFLILLIPKECINDIWNFNKFFYYFYLISFIEIFISFSLIIGVLGINVVNLFTFPEYIVLKRIDLLNFIQNVESISSSLYLMYSFSICALLINYIKVSIKSSLCFHIKTDSKLTLLVCLFMFIVTVLKKDIFIESEAFVIYPFICLVVIIFILIIYLSAYTIKKINT